MILTVEIYYKYYNYLTSNLKEIYLSFRRDIEVENRSTINVVREYYV